MKNLHRNTFATRITDGLLSLVIIIGVMGFANTLSAQTAYKIVTGSQIKVLGTSNLHDWSSSATNFTTEGVFTVKNGQLQDITSLSFTLAVKNLKSKESLMDSRTYKALKEDQFKTITFKLTEATIVQKSIKAVGNLTISGVTNQVTLLATYTPSGDDIIIKGSKQIKMSDFKIKAPSFMMGALKTGDAVTIDFTLKLTK